MSTSEGLYFFTACHKGIIESTNAKPVYTLGKPLPPNKNPWKYLVYSSVSVVRGCQNQQHLGIVFDVQHLHVNSGKTWVEKDADWCAHSWLISCEQRNQQKRRRVASICCTAKSTKLCSLRISTSDLHTMVRRSHLTALCWLTIALFSTAIVTFFSYSPNTLSNGIVPSFHTHSIGSTLLLCQVTKLESCLHAFSATCPPLGFPLSKMSWIASIAEECYDAPYWISGYMMRIWTCREIDYLGWVVPKDRPRVPHNLTTISLSSNTLHFSLSVIIHMQWN